MSRNYIKQHMQVSIFQRKQQQMPTSTRHSPSQFNQMQLKLPMSQSVKVKNTSSVSKRQLPQIQSPFLKKTVYNLFPFKPPLSERFTHQSKFDKYQDNNSLFSSNHPTYESTKKIFNNIEFTNETSAQTKIKWNFANKSKKQTQQLDSQIKHQRCSNLFMQFPQVQNLQLNSLKERSERVLLNKLITKSEQSCRQYKRPNYVAKHKMNESLYREQKHQIKVIRDYLTQKNGNSVGKSISIKTYSKFFPNVISINN